MNQIRQPDPIRGPTSKAACSLGRRNPQRFLPLSEFGRGGEATKRENVKPVRLWRTGRWSMSASPRLRQLVVDEVVALEFRVVEVHASAIVEHLPFG